MTVLIDTPAPAATSAPRENRRRVPFASRRWAVWVGRVVALAIVLVAWELLVRAKVLSDFDVSRPGLIWSFLVHNVPTGQWWLDTWTTIQEVLIGLAIGATSGMLVGALLGWSPYLSRVFDPYIAMLNSLPRIALYPLMLTWFGLGIGSKIALVIGIVFFIMVVNTQAGMIAADSDVLVNAQVLGATRWQRIMHVDVPSAIPAIFGGLRLSISYGLLAAVTGEMLAGYQGLGQKVSFFSSNFNTTGVIGILLFLAVLATILNVVTGWMESRLLRWRED